MVAGGTMQGSSQIAYLFLEIAVTLFAVGFAWGALGDKKLVNRRIATAVLGLFFFWFAIDQLALILGLWSFPQGGSLPYRIFSLPLEEYGLFFLHSIICLCFIRTHRASEN